MDLEITPRNHYEAIFHAALVSIGMVIALFYLFHRFEYHPAFIIAFSIWFGVGVISGLYLHIEYWLRNRGEKYRLEGKTLTRVKNGHVEEYKSEEIKKIVVFMSPNLYKNWYLYFLSMEQYHYARVFLKNGERLYITCLLAPRVDQVLQQNLRNVKIERKKWVFNTTYTPESWYS